MILKMVFLLFIGTSFKSEDKTCLKTNKNYFHIASNYRFGNKSTATG